MTTLSMRPVTRGLYNYYDNNFSPAVFLLNCDMLSSVVQGMRRYTEYPHLFFSLHCVYPVRFRHKE